MKTTDEYKVCTLEEAKTFARKREHMKQKEFSTTHRRWWG
jgi:hypothetical protein